VTARDWNGARFDPDSKKGHYESWFLRANHPTKKLAFWIRYTIFAARDGTAEGELWAIVFDGDAERVTAVKEEHPLAVCSFAKRGLDVAIAAARLDESSLDGHARRGAHSIAWSLRYQGGQAPLLLLPERMYDGVFPRAKALVPQPNARFEGTIEVDGTTLPIDGWLGSQNHNWGSRHTDEYAWGQVCGFDEAPDAFLELSTARLALGPVLGPRTTVLVLRVDGEELRLNALHRALRARAFCAPFFWEVETRDRDVRVRATIGAPRSSFVALPYRNPPGGTKTCLNSKLARCTLEIERNGHVRRLTTSTRAAFELLGDAPPPPGTVKLS
jgi:hypothetical protein